MHEAYAAVSAGRFWELAQGFFLFLEFMVVGVALAAGAFYLFAD
jgi:hypothetical protein